MAALSFHGAVTLFLSLSLSLPLSFSLSHFLSHPPSLPLNLSLSRSLSSSLFCVRGCTLQPRSFNNPVNRDSTTVPTYLPACLPTPFPRVSFYSSFPLSRNLSPSLSLVLLLRSPNRCIFLALTFLPSTFLFHSPVPYLLFCDSFATFVARTTTIQLSLELYQNTQGINITFVGHSLILGTKSMIIVQYIKKKYRRLLNCTNNSS